MDRKLLRRPYVDSDAGYKLTVNLQERFFGFVLFFTLERYICVSDTSTGFSSHICIFKDFLYKEGKKSENSLI